MDHLRNPLLRHGARLIAGRRRIALRVALLSCSASLLALIQPWLSKILVDEGALRGDLKVLAVTAAGMLVAPLVGLAVEALTRFDYLNISSNVLFGLRERIFGHLQTLSPAYYSRVGLGDLAARFDGDIAEVQRFLVDGPLALLNGIFNLLAITGLMLLIDVPMACIVLASVIPASLWHAVHNRQAQESSSREVRRQSTRLSGFFLDSLRSVKAIQSSNGEAARLAGLRQRHDDYYQALLQAQQAGFSLAAGQRIAGLTGSVLVFAGGGYLLAEGRITVGTLVAFIAFAARIGGPFQTLAGLLAGWQRLKVSIERLSEVFVAETGQKPATDTLPAALRGELRLEGVAFAYQPEHPVLRDADLHITAGSKVLVTGPSGAGKSTFADLLLRHLQPTAGSIQVDGIDIAGIEPAALRSRIAVVDQEPAFLPGSVAENLRFVRPAATDDELRSVLGAVGLSATELPLNADLGGIGPALSRGQRLRLALARALLRAPSILVLDETTSAVDAAAEARIIELIWRRFAGLTCIVISHNGHLAVDWDIVCQLRDGRFDVTTRRGLIHAG